MISPFIEKSGFLLSGQGVTPLPPTPLVVRPLKKTLFLCVSSLSISFEMCPII